MEYFFAQIFWDFAQIFDKSNLFGVRLHPQLLHHCVLNSFVNKRLWLVLSNPLE